MIIGIETELHSDTLSADDIAKREGLNFTTFTYLKDMSIGVKLSREFYDTTIEYNFTPFENTIENFKQVRNYLSSQVEKYNLEINNNIGEANFVGTHIHIFDKNRVNMQLTPLIEGVCGFIIESIDYLEHQSIIRLLYAHQLWGNYSWRNEHIWKNFLNENSKSPYIYDNTRNKNKYNPVIYSKENEETGKPKSLEIRLIPNDFIFDLRAYELIKLIDNKRLSSKKILTINFFRALYKKLYNKTPVTKERVAINTTSINGSSGAIYYIDDPFCRFTEASILLKAYGGGTELEVIIRREGIGEGNYNDLIEHLLSVSVDQHRKDVRMDLINALMNFFSPAI